MDAKQLLRPPPKGKRNWVTELPNSLPSSCFLNDNGNASYFSLYAPSSKLPALSDNR